MHRSCLHAIGLLSATAALTAAAAVTPNDDRASFLAGLSAPTTDRFTGMPDRGFTEAEAVSGVNFGPFTASASPDPGLFVDGDFARDADGGADATGALSFTLFIESDGDSNGPFVFTFADPVTAFGADWGTTEFQAISPDGLEITINGTTTNTNDFFFGSGFLGFTSDMPFTTVSISTTPMGAFGTVDTFSVDNVVVDSVDVVITGDYNRDGAVTAADYTVWADTFGSTTDLRADGNTDGAVTAADYTIWADHFGDTAPGSLASGAPGAAVPEPGSLALLGLAGLALGRRRLS